MSQIRFQRCDPEESPASALLAEMTAELNEAYGSVGRLDVPAVSPADLRDPSGAYLVAYEGVVAVAGGGLRLFGPGVAEIKRMYVRPQARSRGVAGALLAALESTALSMDYGVVRLDTGPKQVHALRLYRSAGYADVAPFNDNPFACFWGEKVLPDRQR
jgi:GNAT superfamily N-acetyltransferase